MADLKKIGAAAGVLGAIFYYNYYYKDKEKPDLGEEEVEESTYNEPVGIRENLPIVDKTHPLYVWLKQIPKIELHAHLHGSIREKTILELIKTSNVNVSEGDKEILRKRGNRTLKECWKVFKIVHQVVQTKESLHRITVEMIEDFAAENCKYLEIRTGPRPLTQSKNTPEEFVQIVLDAIHECDRRVDLSIRVNLILSINRGKSLNLARQTLDLALKYKKRGVVGIEFSGPPPNPFSDFQEYFEEAKEKGLGTTIHCAEWNDIEDTMSILKFKPDRIGHFVKFDEEAFLTLNELKIPVEICPSSNVISGVVGSINDHPFRRYQENYPLSICTDDRGVFHISLTHEFYLLAKTFNLAREDIEKMIFESVNYTFLKEKHRKQIRKKITKGFEKLRKEEN